MDTDEAILAELKRIRGLIELAKSTELAGAREAVLTDELDAAILKATRGKWVGSSELQSKIKGHGDSTIRKALAQLADRGFLERRGGERSGEYRATGLV